MQRKYEHMMKQFWTDKASCRFLRVGSGRPQDFPQRQFWELTREPPRYRDLCQRYRHADGRYFGRLSEDYRLPLATDAHSIAPLVGS